MSKTLKIVCINILVFISLLLCVEVGFRLINLPPQSYSKTIFGSQFAPYVMFINQPGWKNTPYSVFNQFSKDFSNGTRSTNNLGYAADEDFDFASRPVTKKQGEKVVVFTGGSAAAGAGASSNDHLISAYMERILNANQNATHYKVINFGNGGWISFQEFIGLALWARVYDPDWVVTMDGRNDIAVSYCQIEEPGNPMHYNQMNSYIFGYMQSGQGTSFYRGWFENILVKYSKAYSTITKKYYVPNIQNRVEFDGIALIGKPSRGGQIDRICQFYTNSLENIVNLFPKAKCIVSLQPLAPDFTILFAADRAALEAARKQVQESVNGPKNYGAASIVFWHQVKADVPAMVARYPNDRVVYKNMNELFPPSGPDREKFFLDEAHMPDAGQELVALYYAYTILASDFPAKAREYTVEMNAKIAELVARTPRVGK